MPPEKSGYYYPNKFARLAIEAMGEIMGRNGLNAILNLAGLQQYVDNYPPDNLEKGFDFVEFTALNVALEDMYGPRGGPVVGRAPHRARDPGRAAPLLCAGITTYSPLRKWGAGKGKKVGIVGLGGLGHMGVKFAHALGAHTVLFTTSESKIADGKKLGADEVIISKNADAMAKHAGSFDLIVDTVSADHDLNAYLALLKLDATLVLVGAPPSPQPVSAFSLLMPRRSLAGSLIGGIAETQEMLDFCGKHNIACDIELIKMQQINEAYERMLRSDVKYRFVIDMASLK